MKTDNDEIPARIILDDESFDAFSATINNPPKPNEKLRELFRHVTKHHPSAE